MKKIEPFRIGILPLGLIGASLAKALSRARRSASPGSLAARLEIVGLATREAVLAQALQDGAIDRGGIMPRVLEDPDWQAKIMDQEELLACDLIFLCTPVESIAPLARLIASHSRALLTDVGSVKNPIMTATAGLPFIGGHPMAGSERTGYYCATESLFDHAAYALCPPATPLPDQEAKLKLLEELVTLLGARSLRIEPLAHDRLVARISHLPHVVAAGLVNAALDRDDKLAILLSAGGFRDITRIASSDPALWAGISLESGEALSVALADMIAGLEAFRCALNSRDHAALQKFFASASEKRAWVPQQGVGPLISDEQILINIEDKPGVLAQLTSLLSEARINIHNLSIQDARQFEGGQVRLFISSPTEAARARELLREAGYDCEN
ncbi:MAG: prephenate dehydrogenase/arogenate dehydrogenase family protein [Clostridiaceae bacterium]|nr:prephenate dehydrogenase/arogenate dehydrogenase family protein [Clostridiaceae bacterium]